MKTTGFTCVRGGLTIRGHEYRGDGERQTAIILSHGFMSSEEEAEHYARHFAGRGFAAYTYDFCGGGPASTSDGSTVDMTVFTEEEDLKAVFAHVRALPYVDGIVLMGFSQGGFVSALAAADLQAEVAKLVLFYPAFCIPDHARRGQMIFARFDPADIPETVPCGPMLLGRGYPETVLRMDPYAEIGGYTGPVLLVHGTADGLVEYRYSERAAQVYRDAQLVPIAGADHGFRGQDDEQAIAAVDAFLG